MIEILLITVSIVHVGLFLWYEHGVQQSKRQSEARMIEWKKL